MTQTVTSKWAKDISGNYTTGADWTPSGPPNNTAAFDYFVYIGGGYTVGSAAFTVTSSANEKIGFLEIGGNATFAITGGVFQINSFLHPSSTLYNTGKVTVAAGATLSFGRTGSATSGIWNNGAVSIAGTMQLSANVFDLFGSSALTLSGKIVGTTSAGQIFVNRSTVVGSGSIGVGGNLLLLNAQTGVINANSAAAMSINTGAFEDQNAGTIETTGAGGLSLLSDLENDGLLLDAGTGALRITNALVHGGGDLTINSGAATILKSGEVSLAGVLTINTGGALSTSTGDIVGIGTGNVLAGDVLSAGDLEDDGKIIVNDHSILNVNASIYGAGVLDLNASTTTTELEVFGNGASFYQTGGTVLSNNAANKIVSNGAGVQLSNYSRISGAGAIGDGWLRLFNTPTGSIVANDSNFLAIVADSKAVSAGTEKEDFNAGTISNTGSGGLYIQNGTFSNAGYIIENGTGALTLSKLAIDGGGGFVEALSGRLVLSGNSSIASAAGVKIFGGGVLTTTAGDTADAIYTNVTNAGSLVVAGQSTLLVEGHWVNTKTITVGSSTAAATLEVEANATLELFGVAGVMQLNNVADKIASAGANTTFENKTNTISGGGTIGDANMSVDNEYGGVIDATLAGGMTLNATAEANGTDYLYNAGRIQADAAAGVTIKAGMYSPGKLVANAGSKIVAQGNVLGRGTATINGAASIEFGAITQNDVYFAGPSGGDLILDHSTGFSGDIFGMGVGDAFDLRDFHFVANETGIDVTQSSFGDLSASIVLVNGTSSSTTIHLEGHYTRTEFQVVTDNNTSGGTLVKLVS